MSKTLEIAEQLDAHYNACPTSFTLYKDASAELRNQDAEIKRLRELNAALVKALNLWESYFGGSIDDAMLTLAEDGSTLSNAQSKTKKALAKAKEQV